MELKNFQQSKKYTLLKNQTIGLDNVINTNIIVEDTDSSIGLNDRIIPCIVEFSVHKNAFKTDSKKDKATNIQCYVNNTITYHDGRSICFRNDYYKIGTSSTCACNLAELLRKGTVL